MRFLRSLPALLLLAALVMACGGGGGGAAPGDDGNAAEPKVPEGGEAPQPPPGQVVGTQVEHVIVRPLLPLDLPAVLADLGLEQVAPIPGTEAVLVRVPAGRTPVGLIAQLEQDVRVKFAELDIGIHGPEGDGLTIPAGSNLFSVELPFQDEALRIGLGPARDRATGSGVVVAVIDTGVLPDHEFLAGRIAPGGRDFIDDDFDPSENTNGLDDDADGYVDEGLGHGSFVASLILAAAPDAQILPIRALGTDNFGASSGLAGAIHHAMESGAHVIHLSIDLPPESELMREAIQNAEAFGVAVILSAGNRGEADPAGASDSGFRVGAVDENDQKTPFSNYGATLDVLAPGREVHGAYPDPDTATARWSGTSFSAAFVTGGYALLRELDPFAPVSVLLDRLRNTAVSIDHLNPDHAGGLGAGRIDLDAATLFGP